jgi:hypothetical protein
VHGVAKSRFSCELVEQLFESVAEAVPPRLRDFDAQNFANMVWAYAKSGHPAPALLSAIAEVAAPKLREFGPQNLANIAWAYVEIRSPRSRLRWDLGEVDLWAAGTFPIGTFPIGTFPIGTFPIRYATASHAAPALFDEIAAVSLPRLGDFNSQDLANTAFPEPSLNLPCTFPVPSLYLGDFNSQDLANTAFPEPPLNLPCNFNSQDLANTAWAYATAAHAAPALFDAIAAVAEASRLRGFNPQALSNLP